MQQSPSSFRQAVIAVVFSAIVLALIAVTAWFAGYADDRFGHGPLPSGLDWRRAYLATLLVGLSGVVCGAGVVMGMRAIKQYALTFAWLAYVVLTGALVLWFFAPIQRFGAPPFLGLPEFLVSVAGRMVVTVALGALLLGGVDFRRIRIGKPAPAPAPEPIAAGAARSERTVIRGLPGRFTPNAWRSLSFMQDEAKRFDHGYMGTEHLLLGILRDEQSVATRALINLKVDIASVRAHIEQGIGRRGSLYSGTTGLTRRCQQVIEGAARLSRADGQQLVGTGHLLHSLVQIEEDMAAQTLQQAGVTPTRLANELRRLGPESE